MDFVRWGASLTAGLLLLAGCSEGGHDNAAPTTAAQGQPMQDVRLCSDVYAEGAITDEDVFDRTCWAAPDGTDPHVYGATIADCTDGRRLAHNDVGWGYIGEPWHRHPDRSEQLAPQAEREACDAS